MLAAEPAAAESAGAGASFEIEPVADPTTGSEPVRERAGDGDGGAGAGVGAPGGWIEAFMHVRVNRAGRMVEFDGTVCVDVHHPETPIVYLEQVVCTPDTKEHESLVVTPARPSEIHAALVLAGLEAGRPGSWATERVAPVGAPLRVEIRFDGDSRVWTPGELIVREPGGVRLDGSWVFAGSREVEWNGGPFYDADGTGTVVGLATFGSEVVAWSEVISHESAVDEPVWIVDRSSFPALGTAARVRLVGE